MQKDPRTRASVQLTLGQTMQRWRLHGGDLRHQANVPEEVLAGSPSTEKTEGTRDVVTPPGRDPRRLYIPDEVFGGYSPLQKQYWGIKSKNADLVLFVRVGGFYELFGDDADIGALVGLKLMGGATLSTGFMGSAGVVPRTSGGSDRVALHRAGCRAQSFLFWASKVVALGYSVGRVEEVPTDCTMGVSSNQKGELGQKAKTKERVLVQVYSPGTFGLWCEGFDDATEHSSSTAAFVALCEDVRTSGLLGACCVDVVDGVLSVGVWQEVDVERSVLGGMTEAWGVREVVVDDMSRLSVDTRRAVGGLRVSTDAGVDVRCSVRFLRDKNEIGGSLDYSAVAAEAARLVATAEKNGIVVFKGSTPAAHREAGMQAIVVALRYLLDTRLMSGMATRIHVRGMDVGEDVSVSALPGATLSASSSPPTSSPLLRSRMVLNGMSLRNLEIFQGASLHRYLSGYACTTMGSRAIRRWLARPLMEVEEIEHRLDAVDIFRSNGCSDSRVLRDALLKLHDVERKMPMVAQQLSTLHLGDANDSLMALAMGPANPVTDGTGRVITLGQVKNFASVTSDLYYFSKEYTEWFRATLSEKVAQNPVLHSFYEAAMATHDVCIPIMGSMPVQLSVKGGKAVAADAEPVMLPGGVWPSVDRCRAVMETCESELAAHQQAILDLIERSCIAKEGNTSRKKAATLRKVRFAGAGEGIRICCHGSLEASMATAFPHWNPVERSKNSVLYKEARLTALARELAEAQRVFHHTAWEAVNVLFNLFLDEYGTLIRFCQSIGEVDALFAFAKLADHGQGDMVMSRPRFEIGCSSPSLGFRSDAINAVPELTSRTYVSPCLFLRDAWNPQLLTHTEPESIVPNTISLGGASPSAFLVSGANSGGKTSVLKTAAIAAIMAQAGSYVPCSDSRITPVTKILTRLGARDRLAAGESTFAIEMKETSAILGQADAYSLAVVDELGRGTGPKEGMAIAWATFNALASQCRSMLATHYHELNEDFEFDPRVARFHMPVDRGEQPFRLRAGPEPDLSSGGIMCAGSAGICEEVLQRAGRVSDRVKRQMREGRSSRESRLAGALLEILRAGPSTANPHRVPTYPTISLNKLQRLQLQVNFLLEDD